MNLEDLSEKEKQYLDLSLDQSWAWNIARLRRYRCEKNIEKLKEVREHCKLIRKIRKFLKEHIPYNLQEVRQFE